MRRILAGDNPYRAGLGDQPAAGTPRAGGDIWTYITVDEGHPPALGRLAPAAAAYFREASERAPRGVGAHAGRGMARPGGLRA